MGVKGELIPRRKRAAAWVCMHNEGCGITISDNHQDILRPVPELCPGSGREEPMLHVESSPQEGRSGLQLQDVVPQLSRGTAEQDHTRCVSVCMWRGSGEDGALLGNMSSLLSGRKGASKRGFAGKRGMWMDSPRQKSSWVLPVQRRREA